MGVGILGVAKLREDRAGSLLRAAANRCFFFFSSRRRHTRLVSDWSSDVCSSDLSDCSPAMPRRGRAAGHRGTAVADRPRPLLARLDRRTRREQLACGLRAPQERRADRENVGEGKSVDFGGPRIIKKKKKI